MPDILAIHGNHMPSKAEKGKLVGLKSMPSSCCGSPIKSER